MAKMFYTLNEVCEKLGKTEDEVKAMVVSQEIEEFRDGDNLVFKVEQIELLKPEQAEDLDLDLDGSALDLGDSFGLGGSASGSIGLAESQSADMPAADLGGPDISAHGESGSAIGLGDASSMASGPAMPKDDLDLSAEMDVPGDGSDASASVSAFDGAAISDAGDTQLGEGLDDDLTLESVGSGSGLLDLTRESDDTSLGAELLEEVYSSDEEDDFPAATGLFEAAADGDSGDEAPQPAAAATAAPAAAAVVAASQGWDPTWSGLSSGLLIGGLVSLMAVFAMVSMEVMGSASGIAQIIAEQFWIWVGSLAGGTLVLGVIGWVIGGKSG